MTFFINMEETLVFIDEGLLDNVVKFFGESKRLKFDKFEFAKRIAKKLGKTPVEIEPIFEELAKKGLLFKVGKKYSTLPLLPGMMEGYFSSKKTTDKKEIANLYEEYLPEFTGSLAESNYPWIRIIPTVKSIEINEPIKSEFEILPFETIKSHIENKFIRSK